jgi:4-amino-4-deoxy-L-arabinose transferase-like glycosyltransferase
MNGDNTAIAYFFAIIIILLVALFFSFLNQLYLHPWLLLCVAAAVVCYILARRAQRRERGCKPPTK